MTIDDIEENSVRGLLMQIKDDINYLFHYRGYGVDSDNEAQFFILNTFLDLGFLEEKSSKKSLGTTGQKEIIVALTAKGDRLLQSLNL